MVTSLSHVPGPSDCWPPPSRYTDFHPSDTRGVKSESLQGTEVLITAGGDMSSRPRRGLGPLGHFFLSPPMVMA